MAGFVFHGHGEKALYLHPTMSMKGSAMKKTLCLVALIIVFWGCQKFENEASEVEFLIQTGQVFNKGVKTTIVHASSVLSIPNDRLMCVWYGGSDEGESDTRIWYSLYDQETWGIPIQVPSVDNEAHWNPVLQDFGSFARVYFKVGTDTKTWKTKYCDFDYNSQTWGDVRELVEGDDSGGRGPVKNKCLVTSDHCIIAGASTEQGQWRVFFDLSSDGGNTWEKTEYVVAKTPDGEDVDMIQPTLWQDRSGLIHAMFRTKSKRIYRSDSDDGGRSWCSAYPTALPNNNSGIDCVTTPNGWLWLAYNPFADGRRSKLVLSLSKDDGEHWEDVVTLEDSCNPFAEYSYPAIIADGYDLVITYTYKRDVIKYAFLHIILEE